MKCTYIVKKLGKDDLIINFQRSMSINKVALNPWTLLIAFSNVIRLEVAVLSIKTDKN